MVEEAAKAEVATWVLSYLWVNAVSKGRQQKPSSPGHTQGCKLQMCRTGNQTLRHVGFSFFLHMHLRLYTSVYTQEAFDKSPISLR